MICRKEQKGLNDYESKEDSEGRNMSSEKLRSREKTRKLFMRCIHKSLSRPERLTVSQWAEKYRILTDNSALPGRWSNAITPYLVEIMDSFNDPYIQNINFVKSTQVGGTETLINATGWIITQNPSPTMIVYPNDELAKDVSNDKLKPAYQKTREIKSRFFQTKSSEKNLRFRGMNLYLRSGNTPAALASKAIKYLFFDEIDKMAGATKKEANPYHLAVERTKTYGYSKKIYTCSTPTLKSNYIWRFHERAEVQKYYFVPCPHCGEMIILKWQQVRFQNDEDNKMTIEERAETASYYCQECGAEITDSEKRAIIRQGEWRDMKKTCREKPTSVSFHINALYSFFVSWKDIALEFLRSKDDPEELQNFINSWLAEPWEDTTVKTSEELVMQRQAEEPQGVVPDWAVMLTAGVDVQETSVYYDIVAWGAEWTSQSIIHGQLLSLNDLEMYMNAEYKNSSGEQFYVNLCLIDSGDQTTEIYAFCLRHEWAIPVKGIDGGNNHYRVTKINRKGAEYDGQQLILVDGGKYKDSIARRLQKENGIGSCMVHADCDLEYAKQLTAEHKVAEGSGQRRRLVWRPKVSHGDNHFTDCRVYASAAADICGVRTIGLYDANEDAAEETPHKKSSWINGY